MPWKKGQKRKNPAVNDNGDDETEIVFNKKKAKLEPELTQEETKPRRSPNGYILPDPLPSGLVITDLRKQQWKIGKSVGLGGFGEIYSAASLNATNRWSKTEEYVIKVEPHSNGPLFVELHFYCRATHKEDIEDFKTSQKMKHLGIPDLKGCGSFVHKNKRLRFIVMPRYGKDLQSVLDKQESEKFTCKQVSDIALQVIDSYEYLHSQGYVHKDLKGSNLLYGYKKSDLKKLYLVDYGLASRYNYMGFHKPFEPDQRSAHEGTLEYTSRDAHLGCVSRRGDIEVLLYALIDWLGGKLPWDTEEGLKPKMIQQQKIEAFHDIKEFLAKSFGNQVYPTFLEDLANSVKCLQFEESPDYNYLRSLFLPYVNGPLETMKDIENITDTEDNEVTLLKPMMRKPSKRRSMPLNKKRQNSTSQPWTPLQMGNYNERKNEVIRSICEDSLSNPTPAMLEQLARMQKRRKGSPSINGGTTRRKGLMAKRRLSSRAPIEGSEANPERKGNKEPFNLDKGDTTSRQLRPSPARLPLVRKSPRKNNGGALNSGKHLIGGAFNLVKSALNSFFNQEE